MARVKICPSCRHQNPPEQPFCVGADCGFALADVEISDAVLEPVDAPTLSGAALEAAEKPAHTGTWREAPAGEQGAQPPVLKFPWGDVEVSETLFVGRDPSVSPLADRLEQEGFGWVSRRHAEIYLEEGKLYVRDVGSINGTFVNGTRIATQPVSLSDGDRISFSQRLTATVKLS